MKTHKISLIILITKLDCHPLFWAHSHLLILSSHSAVIFNVFSTQLVATCDFPRLSLDGPKSLSLGSHTEPEVHLLFLVLFLHI